LGYLKMEWRKKMKRVLTLTIALLIFISISFCGVTTANPAISRISGTDEIETAVKVSQEGWDYTDTVVIARVDEFPDTLAGTVLAYQEDAPILLTKSKVLDDRTKNEIQRLGAYNAIVLGGEVAISPYVENELEAINMNVERIGGENRYETAKKIANRVGTGSKAVIAYGENFPDALAIAPHAAINGYPILLTHDKVLPKVTENTLEGVTHTIAVGGPAVISEEVKSQLPNPVRIAGRDRYETSIEIIKQLNMDTSEVYMATGLEFSYALVGSVLAAKDISPLLLTRGDNIPSVIEEFIREDVKKYTLIGDIDIEDALIDKDVPFSTGEVIELVEPTTVKVETHRGHGSGFFISEDGQIATNAHVVRVVSGLT